MDREMARCSNSHSSFGDIHEVAHIHQGIESSNYADDGNMSALVYQQ